MYFCEVGLRGGCIPIPAAVVPIWLYLIPGSIIRMVLPPPSSCSVILVRNTGASFVHPTPSSPDYVVHHVMYNVRYCSFFWRGGGVVCCACVWRLAASPAHPGRGRARSQGSFPHAWRRCKMKKGKTIARDSANPSTKNYRITMIDFRL